MPTARTESWPLRQALLLAWMLVALPAQANPAEQICEYRSLEVDALTGDIRFIPPQKIGPEDCTDIGGAIVGLSSAWRDLLPPRVRWLQRAQAHLMCQRKQTELGERMAFVAPTGCVFLIAREVCSIVTAEAVSHAQLANAVRHCAP